MNRELKLKCIGKDCNDIVTKEGMLFHLMEKHPNFTKLMHDSMKSEGHPFDLHKFFVEVIQ